MRANAFGAERVQVARVLEVVVFTVSGVAAAVVAAVFDGGGVVAETSLDNHAGSGGSIWTAMVLRMANAQTNAQDADPGVGHARSPLRNAPSLLRFPTRGALHYGDRRTITGRHEE